MLISRMVSASPADSGIVFLVPSWKHHPQKALRLSRATESQCIRLTSSFFSRTNAESSSEWLNALPGSCTCFILERQDFGVSDHVFYGVSCIGELLLDVSRKPGSSLFTISLISVHEVVNHNEKKQNICLWNIKIITVPWRL